MPRLPRETLSGLLPCPSLSCEHKARGETGKWAGAVWRLGWDCCSRSSLNAEQKRAPPVVTLRVFVYWLFCVCFSWQSFLLGAGQISTLLSCPVIFDWLLQICEFIVLGVRFCFIPWKSVGVFCWHAAKLLTDYFDAVEFDFKLF